ncbi:hypothetical protein [Vibrio sp. 1S139]|uniref:hypothetical protein n=1 Tax=Vibrio sp. 1S139 TaxID=3230006 RepID=UPI00352BF613
MARITELGAGPAGNTTDFPIFSPLSDEQVLIAFVTSVSATTGYVLKTGYDISTVFLYSGNGIELNLKYLIYSLAL